MVAILYSSRLFFWPWTPTISRCPSTRRNPLFIKAFLLTHTRMQVRHARQLCRNPLFIKAFLLTIKAAGTSCGAPSDSRNPLFIKAFLLTWEKVRLERASFSVAILYSSRLFFWRLWKRRIVRGIWVAILYSSRLFFWHLLNTFCLPGANMSQSFIHQGFSSDVVKLSHWGLTAL